MGFGINFYKKIFFLHSQYLLEMVKIGLNISNSLKLCLEYTKMLFCLLKSLK